MARTTGLARTHANGTGVAVEVSGPKIDDLAIPTASQKCALHQRAETGLAGIHEPLRLGVSQVANLRRTRLSERRDPAPSLIARGMATDLTLGSALGHRGNRGPGPISALPSRGAGGVPPRPGLGSHRP